MPKHAANDVEVVETVSDGAYTLLVADFASTDTAWEAYETLKSIEDGRTVEIEGVIVVSRSAEGKLDVQKATDHSTKSGLKWGVVGGIALGVIFPPSILGSAAVAGSAGAQSAVDMISPPTTSRPPGASAESLTMAGSSPTSVTGPPS